MPARSIHAGVSELLNALHRRAQGASKAYSRTDFAVQSAKTHLQRQSKIEPISKARRIDGVQLPVGAQPFFIAGSNPAVLFRARQVDLVIVHTYLKKANPHDRRPNMLFPLRKTAYEASALKALSLHPSACASLYAKRIFAKIRSAFRIARANAKPLFLRDGLGTILISLYGGSIYEKGNNQRTRKRPAF